MKTGLQRSNAFLSLHKSLFFYFNNMEQYKMMVGEVKPWNGTLWFIFSAEKCLLVQGF